MFWRWNNKFIWIHTLHVGTGGRWLGTSFHFSPTSSNQSLTRSLAIGATTTSIVGSTCVVFVCQLHSLNSSSGWRCYSASLVDSLCSSGAPHLPDSEANFYIHHGIILPFLIFEDKATCWLRRVATALFELHAVADLVLLGEEVHQLLVQTAPSAPRASPRLPLAPSTLHLLHQHCHLLIPLRSINVGLRV